MEIISLMTAKNFSSCLIKTNAAGKGAKMKLKKHYSCFDTMF